MRTPKTQKPSVAMVLAAGFGKRMLPLTEAIPKPMVKLGGRPLIDHVLDKLAAAGIKRAVVNVHYLPDVLEAHLKTRTAPEIIISDERGEILETGGGVRKALPKLGKAPFVIHNSDTVWIEGVGSNIERLLETWNPATMDCLLLLAATASSIGYDGRGDFEMDGFGRLKRQTGARLAPFVFAGVSVMKPEFFDDAPDGPFSLNVIWDRAIAKGRLYGLRLDGLWMHVGTPQSLEEAEKALADAAAA